MLEQSYFSINIGKNFLQHPGARPSPNVFWVLINFKVIVRCIIGPKGISQGNLQAWMGWWNERIQDATRWWSVNPLTLRAAKIGLTNLEIFNLQRQFQENISWRNVDQKLNNNSSPNILWTFTLFSRYFQKCKSSRRYILNWLLVCLG